MSTPTETTLRNANRIADWLIARFDDVTTAELASTVGTTGTDEFWKEVVRRVHVRNSFNLRAVTADVLRQRAGVLTSR